MSNHPGGKRWLKRAAIVIAGLLVVIVCIGALYLMLLARGFDSAEKIDKVFPEETARPVVTETAKNAQNILLLGSDTRGAAGDDIDSIRGERSDTMMVVHIPADRDHLYVMSILRDSWVEIPGHGEAKINAALSWGGVPLVVQTVETLISARIDHVALIDFEGFKGLTDALGGVTVENEIPFRSGGREFPTGAQKLDGDAALDYVRHRYTFSDGDFQRTRNQQAYIKGVLSKTLSGETLLNPARLSGIVNSIAPYLKVDEGLSAAYIAGLALEMPGLRADDITFFTLPTAGMGTSEDGQSIVFVDWVRLPTLQGAFEADALDEYPFD